MSKTHPDLVEALEARSDGLLDIVYHRSSLAVIGTSSWKNVGNLANLPQEVYHGPPLVLVRFGPWSERFGRAMIPVA